LIQPCHESEQFCPAYLTWLELFVIRAICQWCVASAAIMAASLLLTIVRVALAAVYLTVIYRLFRGKVRL
jgi:uncharacterized membrane protein